MMRLSFHCVEKFSISENTTIRSQDGDACSSREVVIKMTDGTEVSFDLYANSETFPVEIN